MSDQEARYLSIIVLSDGGAAVAGEHFEMVCWHADVGSMGMLSRRWCKCRCSVSPGILARPMILALCLRIFKVTRCTTPRWAEWCCTMTRLIPNGPGTLLPAYRTVAVEGDEHEIRLDRIGGSKGSLTVTVGYRPEFWGENPHVEPFTTTATWSDGEVGSKVVTVSIKDDEGTYGGYGRQGRRSHQVYLRCSIFSQKMASLKCLVSLG